MGLVICYWKSENFQFFWQPKDKKNWVVFVRRKKETQSWCYLQGHARQWRSRDIGGGGGRRDGGGGGGLNMHNTLCCCRHRHFFSSSSSPFQDDDHKTPKEKENKTPLFSLSLARISLTRDLSFSVPGLTHHQTPHPTTEEELTQRQRCRTKDPKIVFVDFPCDKKSQKEKSYNDFSNTHSSK